MNLKNLLLFSILTCLLNSLHAQTGSSKGITFLNNLSWEQVKEKAKKESKYIFVDCYATWCGPCKQMDESIYSLESIGKIMNRDFVSIKVQLDSTLGDTPEIKKWRSTASKLRNEYNVKSFPTYLLFSPKGEIVNRSSGLLNEEEFKLMINHSMDPDKQLYTLLKKYHNKKIEPIHLLSLANSVKEELKDFNLQKKIGHDYLVQYVYKLDRNQIMTEKNLKAILGYMNSTTELGFSILYDHPEKVDSIFYPFSISRGTIERIIGDEIVKPEISKAKRTQSVPKWDIIYRRIVEKYNSSFAFNVINSAQFGWYISEKEFNKAMDAYVEKVKKTGLDTAEMSHGAVNSVAFELFFKHGTEFRHLNEAIKWMEQIVKIHPDDSNLQNLMDTYANLLYKSGRQKEAIEWQEKTVMREEEDGQKYGSPIRDVFRKTLVKMKKGEPTWID